MHLWAWQVIVPLEKVREVLSVPNAKRPTEKYIQVVTKDGHEFWYMGFVNYDKGLKNMKEAVWFAQSQNNLFGGSMPVGVAPYAPPWLLLQQHHLRCPHPCTPLLQAIGMGTRLLQIHHRPRAIPLLLQIRHRPWATLQP